MPRQTVGRPPLSPLSLLAFNYNVGAVAVGWISVALIPLFYDFGLVCRAVDLGESSMALVVCWSSKIGVFY
ncbi:hypothetical protein Bca4012_026566 [Brassica carinata]